MAGSGGKDLIRIVFFGNHTVGVAALKVLMQEANVVGVIAHPDDPEDGVRYKSVYEFSRKSKLPIIRGRGGDAKVKKFIDDCKPELIWVTDYRYILPENILSVPGNGGVNLHPSLLPKYRGRAPVNWAILNGEEKLGLTAHFLSSGVDDGNIIEQESYRLNNDEDVCDALNKLMPLYESLTRRVIRYFYNGDVPEHSQDEAAATIFPARKPIDGRIDWHESAGHIVNLVRAVAAPYPGAFTELDGRQVYIWKVDTNILSFDNGDPPGTVLNIDDESFEVGCGDGILRVIKYTILPENNISINIGLVFT